MKKILLCLASLLLLASCAKPNIYDPNAQIQVNVDGDKYVIPLNHIVRPDTGSYESFETDMGLGYFFWSSGRGLNNSDKNPNILEHEDDIIRFNWTAIDSGIIGNDMPTRVEVIKGSNHRDIAQDKFNLEAYVDSNYDSILSYIGHVYPDSPTTFRCWIAENEDQNSLCQMEYLHPVYNNNILIHFDAKNLSKWQAINAMAIDYMEKWHQD
jgi:opacity protein-like surface antigen